MTRQIPCPECGADQAPELLRCTNCHAFLHDISPWRSDYNLLAIPIALVLGFFLLLTTYIEGSPTQQILGDVVSQVIVVIGIYAIVIMIAKLRTSKRQQQAFRIVRQACNNIHGDWQQRLETVRHRFDDAGLGAFNTLLAYTRLQWLAETAKLPESSRGTMVDSLRQHADTDWEALDSAFATSRYLVWFLPSAGFLGTVWGMTKALQGFRDAVDSQVGEMAFTSGLHDTLQGLGIAFYTTLVGLAMVIPVFFLAVIARRRAQSFLERLDKFYIRLSAAVLAPAGKVPEESHENDRLAGNPAAQREAGIPTEAAALPPPTPEPAALAEGSELADDSKPADEQSDETPPSKGDDNEAAETASKDSPNAPAEPIQ